MKAIELKGSVQNGHLTVPHLDHFSFEGPVRVILLTPENDDIDEKLWAQAAAQNDAFDFLNDPAEDIYSIEDGKSLK